MGVAGSAPHLLRAHCSAAARVKGCPWSRRWQARQRKQRLGQGYTPLTDGTCSVRPAQAARPRAEPAASKEMSGAAGAPQGACVLAKVHEEAKPVSHRRESLLHQGSNVCAQTQQQLACLRVSSKLVSPSRSAPCCTAPTRSSERRLPRTRPASASSSTGASRGRSARLGAWGGR